MTMHGWSQLGRRLSASVVDQRSLMSTLCQVFAAAATAQAVGVQRGQSGPCPQPATLCWAELGLQVGPGLGRGAVLLAV